MIDFLLWVLLALPVATSWPGHEAYGVALLLCGMAGLGLAVAVSRRFPVAALIIVVALTGIDGNYSFALPVISYLVGRRMARIRPAVYGFAGIVAVGTPYLLWRTDFLTWAAMTGVLMYAGLFPWLVGRYRRQQVLLVTAGWERAEQMEREQRILAEQVRLRERTRIAEEMHHSLGHELSLLALRAGALELAPDLGERHRAAAADLRAGAGTATDRLREIIGLLHIDDDPPADDPLADDRPADDPAAGHPAAPARPAWPVDESIPELVRRAEESGMVVRLRETGDAAPVPPRVARAAHRVVQEALTNANKHAPGAAVTVELAHGEAETLITINNDPASAPTPAPAPASTGRAAGRRGLVGLRERVRLVGGSFTASPGDEGGFQVVARLPYASAPTAPAPGAELPTDLATQRRHIQRQARRGLVAAFAVPAVLGVVLGGTAVSYYLYVLHHSVLTPSDFSSLRIGQERDELARLLPEREMIDPPSGDPALVPPGATCRYYRSRPAIFDRVEVYRICFADNRLVLAEVIRPADRDGDEDRVSA